MNLKLSLCHRKSDAPPAPLIFISLSLHMYMDKCEREQLYIERRKLFQGEEDSRCHDFKKIKNSMNFIVNDENMNV